MSSSNRLFSRFTSPKLWIAIGGIILALTAQAQPGTESPTQVNDVTQLNPIKVEGVVKPHTLDELVQIVRTTPGPVSVGGGRYSMGGQTATEQAVQIDMREFNRVLNFSVERKEITVQAGATWRQIQSLIDPHNLSISIMQTYSNFTVGGSLSVNCHGRYVGQGPIVMSVKRIGLVLPDGRYVNASREANAELFWGAIGGYGGLGVIADATLALADNVKVQRVSQVMPLRDYARYFKANVRDNPRVLFHNADIYPNAYDTVRATSYEQTEQPLTETARLIPENQDYGLERATMAVIADAPGGKWLRQHVVDPVIFSGESVTWRNHEASYSVMELEPASRADSTYVLQEYFVPVAALEPFVERMGAILNRHEVNVINISIRHAHQDPGTLLAWARQEVFAFVLYYKQETHPAAREAVGVWTRELIDAAIEQGGRYYLPYQIHATQAQFQAAYPGWSRYFALKRAVDPTYKFRNKLWDAYFLGTEAEASSDVPNSVRAFLQTVSGYRRDEGQTYLTVPEWYLVYSPDEYAQHLSTQLPSSYPYFGAIGQFWDYYGEARDATRAYPFNTGYHTMVSVIGASFTAENALKGAYENSVGRLSEWTLAPNTRTPEDLLAAEVARDYVAFIRVQPWYEYSFWQQFKRVWTDTPLFGPNGVRKTERKFILSVEYLLKAAYGGLIKLATKTAYGDADEQVVAVVRGLPESVDWSGTNVRLLQRFDRGFAVIALPRYEAFMDSVQKVLATGGQFVEIAGNRKIFLTAVGTSQLQHSTGRVLYRKPILTRAGAFRVGEELRVENLKAGLSELAEQGLMLEHLYDY